MAMPSNRGAAVGRKKDEIHFVNARPSSEPERLKIQRLVRAHVGKWISDQTKNDRSTVPDPSSEPPFVESPEKPVDTASHTVDVEMEDGSSPPSLGGSSSSHSPESISSNSLCLHRTSIAQSAYSVHHNTPEVHVFPIYSSSFNQIENEIQDDNDPEPQESDTPNPPFSPGYIEAIGSGFDPFCSHPTQHSSEAVLACENYCLSVLWPGLTPGSTNGSGVSALKWLPVSLQSPTLFTAFMFGSLSHKRVQWLNHWIPESTFRPQDQQLLQLCEYETIKMINQEVSNPRRAVCDAVILSVMCMAHNVADTNDRRRERHTPFNAPMRRLQWLDVYGCLQPNLIHIQGLIQMVRLRGGLKNITLPGLSPILCFSDIVTSTTYCTPPVFEFISLGEDRNDITLEAILDYTSVEAFERYGSLQRFGLSQELTSILFAMEKYMAIVDIHVGAKSNIDLSLLADQRNLIHYILLSIPAAHQYYNLPNLGDRKIFSDQEVFYEACRLAIMIYSIGVVFPLPAQSTPLAPTSSLLSSVLLRSNPTTWEHPYAQIVLAWVLTMGGIAAEMKPSISDAVSTRLWFISTLARSIRSMGISEWDQFVTVLQLMPWHKACDEGGRRLWAEAKAINLQT